MRIKLRTEDTNKLLWRDSPCTLRNTLQNITIDRSSRFHLGSIYHQDQINKAKKVFTELEKPELLLLNFRRQISEATARRQSKSTRHPVRSKYISSEGSPMSSAGNTGSKFYKVPQKLQLKFDRYGYRSNYVGDYDINQLVELSRRNKGNFSASHRLDLSRPHNFYPGPGIYFRDSKEQKSNIITRKCIDFKRKLSKGDSASKESNPELQETIIS